MRVFHVLLSNRSRWAVEALLARSLTKLNRGDLADAERDARRALALARDIGCLE